MGHDATKQLLGVTGSSAKDVSTHNVDPATYLAGLAVRMDSAGLPSLLKTAGGFLGVSLGRSLSDIKKTSVVRSGESVPILMDSESADGTVTITSYANLVSGTDDALNVAGVSFVAQAGAATLGQATFQAATSNDATAASLAAQINAHATSGALVTASVASAIVTITAKAGGAAGNAVVLAYTDNDTNIGLTVTGSGTLAGGADEYDQAIIGSAVYISDTTGKATQSGAGSTISNAVYVSNALDGINESGATVKVALIDMPGGL